MAPLRSAQTAISAEWTTSEPSGASRLRNRCVHSTVGAQDETFWSFEIPNLYNVWPRVALYSNWPRQPMPGLPPPVMKWKLHHVANSHHTVNQLIRYQTSGGVEAPPTTAIFPVVLVYMICDFQMESFFYSIYITIWFEFFTSPNIFQRFMRFSYMRIKYGKTFELYRLLKLPE